MTLNYQCSECGERVAAAMTMWRCALCGGPMNAAPALDLSRDDIDVDQRSLWRYRRWLAYAGPPRFARGEGWTPLVRQSFDGHRVEWKCDFINPSGSFKDRGIAVMVNFLSSEGITAVTEDSSGNGGASLATYAAAAGLTCRIYVPASTSEGKVAQITAAGSEVVRVTGERQAVAEAAMADASGAYYASHNWHPMFGEGLKTLGYEIWEQLAFTAPDVIVAPTGGGSNLWGCFRAFQELFASELVGRIPRLFGVQPAACDPMTQAMRAGADHFVEVAAQPTIAEGIAISKPVRSKDTLRAVRESGGTMKSVTEAEIRDAYYKLARMGLYVEPTSAAAAAGLSILLREGLIEPAQSVVVILTGTGLKSGPLPTG